SSAQTTPRPPKPTLFPYTTLFRSPKDKEITIQAVAMQWKWLFIYPEEKIATVNFLQIPTKTPIRFEVTADAPMNSLWIPELGGRSEEHTSELQSRENLVCRLLLEK